MTERLAPLDLAVGLPLGTDGPARLDRPGDPLAAVEAAVLGALRRPPCLVSFSGGRDSSAVLAVATRVARREGLPDPIPVTVRAAAAPGADESRWQELVVAHLGLRDWVRLEFAGELDLLGPIARRVLRRHGLLWPFNVHFHVPMLEAASGGSLLTGIGGDELFRSATSARAAAVLAARVRPKLRDARRIALHLSPRRARRAWYARAVAPHPWLTGEGERAVRAAVASWQAAEPRRLEPRMRHVRGARYLRIGVSSLECLADDADVMIGHPLLDTHVWSAVARSAPGTGHLGRTDAMEALFGALLPRELLGRSDKACFDEVFFRDHSRAFAASWSGAGVPGTLIDAAALRSHWLAAEPQAQSFSLLQAAWLASADGVEQPSGGLVERVPAARAAQAQHRQ